MTKPKVIRTFGKRKYSGNQESSLKSLQHEVDEFAFTDEPIHTGFISSLSHESLWDSSDNGVKNEKNASYFSHSKDVSLKKNGKKKAVNSDNKRRQSMPKRKENQPKNMDRKDSVETHKNTGNERYIMNQHNSQGSIGKKEMAKKQQSSVTIQKDSEDCFGKHQKAEKQQSTTNHQIKMIKNQIEPLKPTKIMDVQEPSTPPKQLSYSFSHCVEFTPQESNTWSMLDNELQTVEKSKTPKTYIYNIASPIESFSSTEQESSKDSKNIPSMTSTDSLITNSVSSPISFTKSESLASSLSVKRTYSAVRSYLSDDTHKHSSLENLDFHEEDDEDEHDSSKTAEDDGNIRSVNELRAMGGQSHFMDEVQYLLDGLKQPKSSTRASLLELAEKVTKADFIRGFKSTSFPQTLFEYFANNQDNIDDLSRFLFAFIVYKLLEDGTGLAPNVIDSVLDNLDGMLNDTLEISRPSVLRKSGTSKNFQVMFREFIDKQKLGRTESIHCSSCLLLLNILVLLEESGPKIFSLLSSWLIRHIPNFLSTGTIVSEAILQQLDDESYDEHDVDSAFLGNIDIMHLVLVQYEYLIPLAKSSFMRLDGQNLFKILIQLLVLIMENGTKNKIFKNLEQLLISTLRVLILLTSDGQEEETNNSSKVSAAIYNKDLYSIQFAHTLVQFLSMSDSEFTQEALLYGWGLLINIIQDSASIGQIILNKHDAELFKEMLHKDNKDSRKNNKIDKAKDDKEVILEGQILHNQGCKFLVLGLLAVTSYKRNMEFFSTKDVDQIKKGLSQFEDSLNENWGRGLQLQVSRVLKDLQESK